MDRRCHCSGSSCRWRAAAHDHRILQESSEQDVEAQPIGPVAATAPSAVLQQVDLAAPGTGSPSATSFTTSLTRNPDTSLLAEEGFTTPDDACEEPVCREVVVDVPEAAGEQTLYARAAWANPSQYVHVWGIAPDGSVVGKADVAEEWDKSVGNDTSLPLAEFTVPDPQPGKWRIQVRAVFGYEIPVSGLVLLTQGKALVFPKLDMCTLADQDLTQNITMNTVFAGREWTKDEIAVFREYMPLEHRLGVLPSRARTVPVRTTMAPRRCATGRPTTTAGRRRRTLRGPSRTSCRPSSRSSTASCRTTGSGPRTCSPRWRPPPPRPSRSAPTTTTRPPTWPCTTPTGKPFRGPDAQVTNPSVGDKISATAVERWIFENRLDRKYASSFTDIETGQQRSGVFITPDPDAVSDPFYTASGKKDLDRMPQGPTTSVTFFVLDTFSDAELTAKYFDRNAYHFFDVTQDDLSLDPDTQTHDGPDYMRVWGGRHHFFFHDLGAGPNSYEAVGFFAGAVPGSAAYPDGDPPIWDYENDPKWAGNLAERTARDAVTMLLYRFVAPYLYRPVPADVYFLAAINWNDCYANPECSPEGISKTDLTKIYQTSYVEQNLWACCTRTTR